MNTLAVSPASCRRELNFVFKQNYITGNNEKQIYQELFYIFRLSQLLSLNS